MSTYGTKMTLHISIKSEVYETLAKVTSPSKAAKGLDNLKKMLLQEMENSIGAGTAILREKQFIFSIPMKKLSQSGPRVTINGNATRLYKWLNDNQISLLKFYSKGSNVTKEVSRVIASQYLTVSIQSATEFESRLTDLIKTLTDKEHHVKIKHLFPYIAQQEYFLNGTLTSNCEFVQVNAKGVRDYIHELEKNKKRMKLRRYGHEITQARKVLEICFVFQGKFLQIKKPASEFGRTYYYGTSIQSVSKTLRSFMLQDNWEYDLRSSVVSWKMGFAFNLISEDKGSIKDAFPHSHSYATQKDEILNSVCASVFCLTCSSENWDERLRTIKRAFTAIAFGARTTTQGWPEGGDFVLTAVADLFDDETERNAFFQNRTVREFSEEQATLDKRIKEAALKRNPELRKMAFLKTEGEKRKLSGSKLMAYLYQHAETKLMDLAAGYLCRSRFTVIARIHDAIIVDRRITGLHRIMLHHKIISATKNSYWHLCEKQLRPNF